MIELHNKSRSEIATREDGINLVAILDLVPAWYAHAACRGADTNLFFPEKGASNQQINVVRNQYCANCPVKAECREAGIEQGDQRSDHGIWGGTTGNQRRKIRAARQKGLPDPDLTEPAPRSYSAPRSRKERYADLRAKGICPRCSDYKHSSCFLNRGETCTCKRCTARPRQALLPQSDNLLKVG